MGLLPAESGTLITSKAKDVKLLNEGVENCAMDIVQKISSGELEMTKMFVKTEIHPQKCDDSGIDWVFFADTLNFSFWMPEDGPQYVVTYKGTTYTGYLAMCAAINRALDQKVALTDPKYFVNIDKDTLGNLLVGDNDVPIPLLDRRVDCLHEVGSVLMEKFSGSFNQVLSQCENSATKLLELVLTNFPCFNDCATFEGTQVSFHKRAQILVADIWCLFEGTGRGGFSHIEQLTMFADYRVPQSLQHYGVMKYSEELSVFLNKDELLEPGHRWEQEIRGCSIEAVERVTRRVREELESKGVKATVNSILVDQFLWGYRREHSEVMKSIPYHKVRSIYY
eukprot:GFUD01010963.1.p1 GENE.GFUD01010963.1~~GFUD01010963.1.p1  ORF type:complete len:338 (+),score=88.82 GFUD01010963.1:45-1058(+)